ncbi:MAG: rhomboid family intramembrane serine protease [Gammaproteobacteria bacterium]|nr:rhomboid family intramembrane serine protease [Gammaproteobacteria bacterium]
MAAELFGLELWRYGIYPGKIETLAGVLTAPLIHGSLSHITSNSLPLLVMLTILVYVYPKSSPVVLVVLYIGSGLIVWVIAREAWHFGASGLTHGLMFFLFTIGILRRDAISAVFAMIVFFLYGGMVWGIFPRDPAISYEYHLAGAGLGVLLAFLLKNIDSKIPKKRYDWEDEDDQFNEQEYEKKKDSAQ